MSLGRLMLKTPLSPHSGYGNDGIGLCTALMDAGWDVFLTPTMVSCPLPPKIAALLTRSYDPPYDVLLHHEDPDMLGITAYERAASRTTIAWSMWEFGGVSIMRGKDTLAARMQGYDKLICYDDVSKGSLAPFAHEGCEVSKLQGGYFADEWQQDPGERDWSGTFRFAMVGALHQRKDPFAAMESYRELREAGELADSELHMKTVSGGLHPAIEQQFPGVKIHSELWTQEVLKSFYLKTHLLLAPSWGEGKNLPALEAMSSGCPVAATNYGGHAEWMDSAWGYPLDYTLASHVPGTESARVDREQMKRVMVRAYTDRAEARQKGECAARTIPAQCDWAAVVTRLTDRLRASELV